MKSKHHEVIRQKNVFAKAYRQLFNNNLPVADYYLLRTTNFTAVQKCYNSLGPAVQNAHDGRFGQRADTKITRIEGSAQQANVLPTGPVITFNHSLEIGTKAQRHKGTEAQSPGAPGTSQ